MVMLTLANIIFESSFCLTAKKSSEREETTPKDRLSMLLRKSSRSYFTVIFTVLVTVVFRHLPATLGAVTFTFRV